VRLARRPPQASGVPLGTVFGGVLSLGLGLAALWLRLGLPLPVCPLRQWTGIPCPTCGATRMVRAVLAGEPVRALAANPLLFLVLTGVAVWAVAATLGRVLRLPGWRVTLEPHEWWLVRGAAVLAIAGDWIYLLWRAT